MLDTISLLQRISHCLRIIKKGPDSHRALFSVVNPDRRYGDLLLQEDKSRSGILIVGVDPRIDDLHDKNRLYLWDF